MPSPNFFSSFAEGIKQSADRRGGFAFIPWLFILSTIAPIVIYWNYFHGLENGIDGNFLIAVFSAFLVVGGFLGAVSVSAMVQIQHTASTYPFSSYLKEINIFDLFMFLPQYVFLIHLLFIFFSTISTMAIILGYKDLSEFLFFVDSGFMIYACIKTWGLVDVIRKLMWHFEEYNRLLAERRAALAGSK